MIKTLEIYAREVEHNKQKFVTSTAVIGGNWYKIKFRKEVKEAPTSRGIYIVEFDTKHCSVQKGKPFTRKDGTVGVDNDTLWIENVSSIRTLTKEELEQRNEAKVNAIFENDNNPF